MFDIGLIAVLAVPMLFALMRSRGVDASGFAYNNGVTDLFATVCSIVCSNVGIGTFVAIYLFTRASPVIGAAIAVAYTCGLLLCALLAPTIHQRSRESGAYALVDFIVLRHGDRAIWPVWLPICFIFLLRSAVQLAALMLILAETLAVSQFTALCLGTVAVGLYTVVGGYRAATDTDKVQALVILALVALLFIGFGDFEALSRRFFDLGPHHVTLLVGIVLFVPISPVLAVDNWQRITTVRCAKTARLAFMAAAPLCAMVYGAVWWAGMLPSPTGDVLQSFRTFAPFNAPWLADVLFVVAIISSIDTFVVPLVSSFERLGAGLNRMRAAVAAIFVITASIAWMAGDILNTVIASFSSLTVLLPCVIGAFFLAKPHSQAAWVSLNLGVVVTLLTTAYLADTAAIIGFTASAISYAGMVWFKRNKHQAIHTDAQEN